jgi:hypothetical protein
LGCFLNCGFLCHRYHQSAPADEAIEFVAAGGLRLLAKKERPICVAVLREQLGVMGFQREMALESENDIRHGMWPGYINFGNHNHANTTTGYHHVD